MLIGLIFVALELRQNNAIAHQQAVSGNWSTWAELEMAQLDSNIPGVFAKSMTDADDLSLSEQVELSFWLSGVMSAWEHDYASLNLSQGSAAGVLEEIKRGVPFYFGNSFTRGWYIENKYWLSPEIVSAIDDEIAVTALGSDIEHFNRIMNNVP